MISYISYFFLPFLFLFSCKRFSKLAVVFQSQKVAYSSVAPSSKINNSDSTESELLTASSSDDIQTAHDLNFTSCVGNSVMVLK